jgi:hypothetical protein
MRSTAQRHRQAGFANFDPRRSGRSPGRLCDNLFQVAAPAQILAKSAPQVNASEPDVSQCLSRTTQAKITVGSSLFSVE